MRQSVLRKIERAAEALAKRTELKVEQVSREGETYVIVLQKPDAKDVQVRGFRSDK